ncbi:MAG TPA: hypothetical protein VN605_03320, partial [Thermoanaerobaculia bacterium]|nr:hypothetical protein [Thermoanaerobaculia bacterium]
PVDAALYEQLRDEELASIRERIGSARVRQGFLDRAARLFDRMILSDELADFLTIPAYTELLDVERKALTSEPELLTIEQGA